MIRYPVLLTSFLSLLVVTLIAACSSSSKKGAESDDYAGKVEVDSVSKASTKSSGVSSSEATAAAPKPSNSSALSDAIKSGSDENIFRSASANLMQNANDVRSLNAMGLFQYRKGRPLAARLFFRKALSLQPNSSELYSNIGLTYLSTKEEQEAIINFRKSLEINPGDPSAITNLSSIYLEHRDFNKAYSVMTLAPMKSKDVKFLNNFAIACAWKGKTEQAESLYQEALKISPSSRELLFNYAIFQIDYQSKFKEGLETLDHLKLIGLVESMKNTTKDLEIKAKAGLK